MCVRILLSCPASSAQASKVRASIARAAPFAHRWKHKALAKLAHRRADRPISTQSPHSTHPNRSVVAVRPHHSTTSPPANLVSSSSMGSSCYIDGSVDVRESCTGAHRRAYPYRVQSDASSCTNAKQDSSACPENDGTSQRSAAACAAPRASVWCQSNPVSLQSENNHDRTKHLPALSVYAPAPHEPAPHEPTTEAIDGEDWEPVDKLTTRTTTAALSSDSPRSQTTSITPRHRQVRNSEADLGCKSSEYYLQRISSNAAKLFAQFQRAASDGPDSGAEGVPTRQKQV